MDNKLNFSIFRKETTTDTQTRRSFRKRFNDHIPKTQNMNSRQQLEKVNTKYGMHLIDNNHDYTDNKINNMHNNLKPIHFCNKGKILDTLEEFEIYKNTQINADKLIKRMESSVLFVIETT